MHGGFVDGSGWQKVYQLVGHSYGGAVISEAGTHPAVTALVPQAVADLIKQAAGATL